jgi:hypothetical protein
MNHIDITNPEKILPGTWRRNKTVVSHIFKAFPLNKSKYFYQYLYISCKLFSRHIIRLTWHSGCYFSGTYNLSYMTFFINKRASIHFRCTFSNMAAVSRFGVNNILFSINGRVLRRFCPNCIATLSGKNVQLYVFDWSVVRYEISQKNVQYWFQIFHHLTLVLYKLY